MRTSILRLAAVAAAVAVVTICLPLPAEAATYPCSYGTRGRTVLVDNPPEGRPYLEGTEALGPSVRKWFALTTTNANRSTGFCECVQPRAWGHGMDVGAMESLKRAMDAKEAEAISNYANFGVAPEAVPVEARTIWLRTAWRSREEQECLWARIGPGWAARPGTSIHEVGIAIDIEDWAPSGAGQDERLLKAEGWCRTDSAEPWHFEYRPALEARGQANRCK